MVEMAVLVSCLTLVASPVCGTAVVEVVASMPTITLRQTEVASPVEVVAAVGVGMAVLGEAIVSPDPMVNQILAEVGAVPILNQARLERAVVAS
jgi:hypothetical protein